ncbi:MAG: amino acid adenylation domain-containing protein [Flavobacterium sp.]|nr:MAG: amino acid adenylation domain-containing protein [Flavobacterium sp.]
MSTVNQTLNNLSNLTQSQLLIWTGQQLSLNVPLYNSPFTFELSGEINVPHFQSAFQILINKCDAMRMIFESIDDIPHTKLLDPFPYKVELLDLSKEKFPNEYLQRWLNVRMKKCFDLSKPLFDSALIQLPDNKFTWYFNQHHLICDASSVPVQYKAFSKIYSRLAEGATTTSDIEIPQFQNYIEYEKANRKVLENSPVKAYWEERLKSIPNNLKLYGKTVEESTTLSKRFSLPLGKHRTERLFQMVKEKDFRLLNSQLSLFNIFATVLSAYLSRISNEQNNITFGTPIHNRTTPDFKETPGLFIEFFPFVSEVKTADTFVSLFKRVSTKTYELLRNAQSGASTPKLNRAFSVILNYITTEFPDLNGIPCEAVWHHPDHSDPSHHLRLHVYNDDSDCIKLYFDLNRGVFDEKMFEVVPNHFLKLLDAFIEDPNQTIGHASLLSEAEFQQIVIDFNRQEEIINKPFLELFQIQVRENPQKPAVSDKAQNLTYADLDRKSNQLANYLIEKEIIAGKRVVIYLNRSVDLIISILATLKAGCAYIPIAVNNPRSRVTHKIMESQPAILLTNSRYAGDIDALPVPLFRIDADWQYTKEKNTRHTDQTVLPEALAYIMFTSGSTGQPKGVQISQRALTNYIHWAGKEYGITDQATFPLFTNIDFDLTVTSIFVPLSFGASIVVYEELENGPDLAIFDVIEDNRADVIKLTPSHLSLLKGHDFKNSRIRTIIVGGEDFKRDLAESITELFHHELKIYNEYGPTEATVGCIVHRYDLSNDLSKSVPIGKPIANMQAYILDDNLNPVPQGVIGKLYLSGDGLSLGYWNEKELTEQKFLNNPFQPQTKIYDTGDLARLNAKGELEYLGRKDQQVKIGGIRIELSEIESALAKYAGIKDCVVELIDAKRNVSTAFTTNCIRCGLPSNYPSAEFDENGVCNYCLSFEDYRENAEKYFKTPDDFQKLLNRSKAERQGEYDCLMLLSGGKDSTYALAQLVAMGASVLAFTLDNGYISEAAKANIKRVVNVLGVDHVFEKTAAMNEIFVDSLHKYSNVCNGCFKTIYTLSTKVAFENKIPFIVTGLSRGQFFETRLTEEIFLKDDVGTIDKTILEARKSYHRVDDAVKRLLDTSIFNDDTVFEKVQFLDFYRYFDVDFEEMMNYLDKHLPWIRPTDTGRSTNCLINQVGIYVHKKERGYSNYAFPYSWDVRMGHKTRAVSLDEINEEINESEVKRILGEIGYTSKNTNRDKNLVAFYVADTAISDADLRTYLKNTLPEYMIPNAYKRVESFPLTSNGKVDRNALQNLAFITKEDNADYVAPETEFEKMLSEIWSEVLQIEKIGVNDNFLELGGNSLAAIRITSRVNKAFDLDLPLNTIFEHPNIFQLAQHIETSILMMLGELKP